MDTTERARLRALCEAATPGPECTGITAQWCPRCGDCTCPDGTPADSPLCPLHARSSSHGEDEEHGPDTAALLRLGAASRTAIPALLDDLDAADARAVRAERERDDAVADASQWERLAEERKAALDGWRDDCARMGRERDEARAENARLRAEIATARAAAHTADDIRVSQIEELCAVIDGSPDEPTDDELAAHTGAWLARLYNGAFATMTATAVRNVRGVLVRGGPYAVRWWGLDSDERFCPRPVITTVAATLDAGPRDADGREVTP